MTTLSATWLLCLNLSREYVTAGRPLYTPLAAPAAQRARALLHWGRSRGWTIAHVHGRRRGLAHSQEFARPIEGLEPLPSEPLYVVRQKSALAHLDLRARLSADRPPTVLLVGFTLAQDGLATMFDAVDLGLSVRIVADAVASPAIGDRSGTEIDRAALAIAVSVAEVTNTAEVLNAPSSVVVGFKGA